MAVVFTWRKAMHVVGNYYLSSDLYYKDSIQPIWKSMRTKFQKKKEIKQLGIGEYTRNQLNKHRSFWRGKKWKNILKKRLLTTISFSLLFLFLVPHETQFSIRNNSFEEVRNPILRSPCVSVLVCFVQRAQNSNKYIFNKQKNICISF